MPAGDHEESDLSFPIGILSIKGLVWGKLHGAEGREEGGWVGKAGREESSVSPNLRVRRDQRLRAGEVFPDVEPYQSGTEFGSPSVLVLFGFFVRVYVGIGWVDGGRRVQACLANETGDSVSRGRLRGF